MQRPHRRLCSWLARLTPALLLWLHLALHWRHTAAGAALELCYARTLAAGGGLALQPGATHSQGFESLPWVLGLAAAQWLALPLLTVAKLLGAALGGVALALLPDAAARLEGRTRVQARDLLPALLLAAHPALPLHLADGLGGAVVLLLLVLGVRLLAAEEQRFQRGGRRGLLLSCLPLALLLLATPAAPALLAAVLLARLLSRATARRVQGWRDVLWLALLPLLFGVHLLVSYLVFADPWPAVINARAALPEARLGSDAALAQGGAATLSTLGSWGITLPLVGLALAGALRPTLYWARVAVAGLGVGAALLVVATGGAGGGRWLLPTLLALALLGTSGFFWLLPALTRLLGTRPLRVVGVVSLALGLLAGPLSATLRTALSPPTSPLHRRLELADWLVRQLGEQGWRPPQVTVLTDMPGILAWRQFEVVDASGVTDPVLRRYNGNRYPQELGRLVLHDRRPDVLLERPPWSHVHGLSLRPEARRRYVQVQHARWPATLISISRRLLLDDVPRPDKPMRRELGQGLVLLGGRAAPGRLVLLWMSRDNNPAPRRVRLGVGRSWEMETAVGPALYPMPRWRAGEVVRQPVALPAPVARQGGEVWIEAAEQRVVLTGVDPAQTLLEPQAWYRARLEPLLRARDQMQAEALASSWRDPTMRMVPLLDQMMARIDRLMRRGLLREASQQLAEARSCHHDTKALRRLGRRLAARASRDADVDMRLGRWPLAAAMLQVAAMADPGSAWLGRRLQEARVRQPADDHLARVLELELARRAMALAPSGAGLNRVLRALLALGRARRAVVEGHLWQLWVLPDERGRFLLAKALASTGRSWVALGLLQELLGRVKAPPQSRRCPPWFPLQPLALERRLRWLLGREGNPPPNVAPFQEPAPQLGRGVELVASCVRWRQRKVRGSLYLRVPGEQSLELELVLGSRRQRVPVPAKPPGLRQVVTSLLLPPARYPVSLRLLPRRREVPLGRLSVGPEANFGFELPTYAPWRRTGQAFGEVPVVGRSARWRFLAGYQGERYADSFIRGFDTLRGTLRSPPFRLRRDYLMLLVAGGDRPELGVDLVVDGQRRFTARGRRRETMRTVFWPVGRFRGRFARVVIRDDSDRPWGHLAVDGLRQIDGPAPGVAPGE